MQSAILLLARTLFVLAILAIMPILALPPVGAQIDALWSEFVSHPLESGGESAWQTSFGGAQDFLAASTQRSQEPAERPSLVARDVTSRFQQILGRLGELGVTYTKLESQESHYRFECQVPLSDSVYTRTFEHSESDPLLAMEQVLSQVESWYFARHPHIEARRRTVIQR